MKINSKNAFVAGVMALCACACVSCAEEQKSTIRNREYDVMVLEPTSRKLNSVYSASIRGKQDIDIRPKVSGYITDIYVKEGSVVKKGQTLFVIDQVPYEAELQTAIANVDVAQASVDAAELTTNSKERLFEQKIISDFELRMAKTSLASERATLAQLYLALRSNALDSGRVSLSELEYNL